ncbi:MULTISPECIES: helix-turn-helix transcriptional regulator [unclassified Caballeronia]|uniref:helix-turn-helix domain-containing protein n=1 Tax=unclassified Caballeronia TaxID=2646786 RepID=UPI002028744A|nr:MULTISPECIES: helix-turn-helix transcriptional regulator [unclassified Caballeronia]
MSPFSILLHEFRLRSNLRQSDLAEKLGYEQSYLSSLEVGRKGRPTREFVLKVVEVLSLRDQDAEELLQAWEDSCRTIEIPADAPRALYEALNEIRRAMDHLCPAQIEIFRQTARMTGESLDDHKPDRLRIKRRRDRPIKQMEDTEME